jgi:hypothetical protein
LCGYAAAGACRSIGNLTRRQLLAYAFGAFVVGIFVLDFSVIHLIFFSYLSQDLRQRED